MKYYSKLPWFYNKKKDPEGKPSGPWWPGLFAAGSFEFDPVLVVSFIGFAAYVLDDLALGNGIGHHQRGIYQVVSSFVGVVVTDPFDALFGNFRTQQVV